MTQNNGVDISAVVPTRNRKESLLRLLKSLQQQTSTLKEVVVVDSSDTPLNPAELQATCPRFTVAYIQSSASVCIQRNIGIRAASSSYILLCDDDLELPEGYVENISQLLQQRQHVGAITGILYEPNMNGEFQVAFPATRLRNLIWNFIFQLTVWTDLRKVRASFLGKPMLSALQQYYRFRGNTYTIAGWPLVTQVDEPCFRTSLFSLGGSVIRRDWLLQSPYDELLDQHGIGDNYGVVLGFPEKLPVWVCTETHVLHHKSSSNRLEKHTTYFRRILALHYFMTQSPRFSMLNKLFLVWSLCGNFLYQLTTGKKDMLHATSKAIVLIISGKNPYLLAKHYGHQKVVTPML